MKRISSEILSAIAIFTAVAMISGCSSSDQKTANQKTEAGQQSMTAMAGGHTDTAGGITWSVPADWKVAAPKPMRVQTYIVGPSAGDTDSAECAVFFFGSESGGSKDANIQRWCGQFDQPDGSDSFKKASISEKESNGLKITTIELGGTYKVAAGPMMAVKDTKSGYRLAGAIVDGPGGLVFFKMTGPEKTVMAAQQAFSQMLASAKAGA
jgi:uncharacterized protein YceK